MGGAGGKFALGGFFFGEGHHQFIAQFTDIDHIGVHAHGLQHQLANGLLSIDSVAAQLNMGYLGQQYFHGIFVGENSFIVHGV